MKHQVYIKINISANCKSERSVKDNNAICQANYDSSCKSITGTNLCCNVWKHITASIILCNLVF